MRAVVGTNVFVSGLLYGSLPGRVLGAAGDAYVAGGDHGLLPRERIDRHTRREACPEASTHAIVGRGVASLTAACPVRWSSSQVHDRKDANAIAVRLVDNRVREPPHEPTTNPTPHHPTRVGERED